MGLIKVWDYLMRRKILFFIVLLGAVLVGMLSIKLFASENGTIPEIPRTGDVVLENNCDTELADASIAGLGDGMNSFSEEGTSYPDETFWGTEVPDTKIISMPSDEQGGEKAEILILVLGGLAIVTVGVGAKFIFDRYVR